MRNLTSEECSIISGAGDRSGTLTVSAETVGAAIGGGIGSIGGVAGGVVGTIVGGAVGNYVTGDRAPGSVGPSGIPGAGATAAVPCGGTTTIPIRTDRGPASLAVDLSG